MVQDDEDAGSISLSELIAELNMSARKKSVDADTKKRKKRKKRQKAPVPPPPPEESWLEWRKRQIAYRQAWINRNADQEERCVYCEKVHLVKYQFAEGGCRIPSPRPPSPPTPPPEAEKPKRPPLPLPERTARRKARPTGSKPRKDDTKYVPRMHSIRLPRRGDRW